MEDEEQGAEEGSMMMMMMGRRSRETTRPRMALPSGARPCTTSRASSLWGQETKGRQLMMSGGNCSLNCFRL